MSSVLDRSELEQSPLADLHLLANELGVDGFRRLRKAELIEAILARQTGDGASAVADEPAVPDEPAVADQPAVPDEAAAPDDDDEEAPRRRGRRGGRGRGRARGDEARAEEPEAPREERRRKPEEPREERRRKPEEAEDRTVEGTVELLANGSGFVRLTPPEPTDEDVYISAAQVKRCELVSGDRVAGPMRAPRRSERYPSLVRVDTINGRPADEVAEGTRFEDLPAAFPAERLALGGDEPTVKAVEWLTPFGKGSRVVICGAPRAGKSEALRRIAIALAGQDGLDVSVVLAGVRPEEIGEWSEPATALSFGASGDAQAQAVEQAVEQARRVAARGGDAVVLIDTLEFLPPHAARRALASARNIVDGGSLTLIATAPAPVGGETTVIALDASLTALGRFPALDLAASGTMRPELLVGDAGAEAIAKARTETV